MADLADVEIERRRGPRVPVTVQIRYATVDALFSDFTENVNEGGVFVKTDQPLEVEDSVVLHFTLPETVDPIQARGRVVRVVAPGEGDVAGMAIEFEKLDRSAREIIDQLVRELRVQPEKSEPALERDTG